MLAPRPTSQRLPTGGKQPLTRIHQTQADRRHSPAPAETPPRRGCVLNRAGLATYFRGVAEARVVFAVGGLDR